MNSVRWIRGVDYESELVSGSTDGTAIVWSLDSNSGCYKPCTLAGHESNVNVVDGLYKDHEKRSVVVATISVDSTLRIWFRPERTGTFKPQIQLFSIKTTFFIHLLDIHNQGKDVEKKQTFCHE